MKSAVVKFNFQRTDGKEIMSMVRKRSVMRRWLFSSFSIIVVVLAIAVTAASLLIKDYYYNQARQIVESNVNINASYFTATSGVTGTSDYITAAQSYVERFESRETMELQFVDRRGVVQVTSTGFEPGNEKMPDYDSARTGESGLGVWNGDNSRGEKVLAVSQMLTLSNGKEVGAIRIVVSLALVDRHILFIVILLVCCCLFIIALVLVSSFYFFRSIVRPVKNITVSANEIAEGDFTTRLKKDKEDEIGDLVDAINSMAAALAANENLKNDFISSVSHELRTPLTAIKGWGETLRTCGPEDKEIFSKGMDTITREASRLGSLVEDLLDFSRLQRGGMAMNFEKLDILAEIGEAVYFFSDRAAQEEKTLTFFEAENLPPVLGDRNRLRQVFTNLIDNAMKYSEAGSEIHVTAACSGDEIKVMVRDYGCGIAADDLPKVTQKFYKANNTRRGFGIGLGVAEEIIAQHNGKIDITSRVGEGTAVTVTLPVAKEKH